MPAKRKAPAKVAPGRATFEIIIGGQTKGGRPATPKERARLAGRQPNGVPNGLRRCPTCGEWRGSCLDPNPLFAGLVVRVHCRCDNDSLCPRCGRRLYERKINANYYDEGDSQVWHVPWFMAMKHRCPDRTS